MGLVLRREGLRPDSWGPGPLLSISVILLRPKGGQPAPRVLPLGSCSGLPQRASERPSIPVRNPASSVEPSLAASPILQSLDVQASSLLALSKARVQGRGLD